MVLPDVPTACPVSKHSPCPTLGDISDGILKVQILLNEASLSGYRRRRLSGEKFSGQVKDTAS